MSKKILRFREFRLYVTMASVNQNNNLVVDRFLNNAEDNESFSVSTYKWYHLQVDFNDLEGNIKREL